MISFSAKPSASPKLLICLFGATQAVMDAAKTVLDPDRYSVIIPTSQSEFFHVIEAERQQIDCLILHTGPSLANLISWLHDHATLLPTIILQPASITDPSTQQALLPGTADFDRVFFYHSAEICLSETHLDYLGDEINRAIAEFLTLSPVCRLPVTPAAEPDLTTDLTTQNFLMLQQRRLTDKLKERLGYLGVYYKRSPRNFLRNLPVNEQHTFLQELKKSYREIIIGYFSDGASLNQKIDAYVDVAFLADIPVSKVVEIHMEIMDEFAKQLKLEGRSEEVVLDYRLTLIDTLAHLCEMYRRSIPRESSDS
ncbi:circadian clock protein KaiA [Alkalinema pantanalense CENA528]|uniref:circadian clock protein KaiA n=1 Tax=Alkalinema pantanalense TaxID=1620705 RepID=UPI003D6E5412